jgi:D-amino peptidase
VTRNVQKQLGVLIVNDMEGISGISGINDWRQIFAGCKEYEDFGRVQVTEDVNAAVRGLRSSGATNIRVVDFHGSGGLSKNVISNRLENNVRLFQGPDLPGRLKKSIDKSVKAAVFVGFHAMADTRNGFLRHTISMDPRIGLNGKTAGETAINAYALAEHGIPTIMITGDQAVIREASGIIPEIETVQVKTSKDCRTTKCLPLSKARRLIEKGAKQALSRLKEFKPIQLTKPVRIDISFLKEEQAALCEIIPRSEKIDEKTVSYTAETWEEADRFIMTSLSRANQFHTNTLIRNLSRLPGADKISFKWAQKRINEWLS